MPGVWTQKMGQSESCQWLKMIASLFIRNTMYCQSREVIYFLLSCPFLGCDYTTFKGPELDSWALKVYTVCLQHTLTLRSMLMSLKNHWPIRASGQANQENRRVLPSTLCHTGGSGLWWVCDSCLLLERAGTWTFEAGEVGTSLGWVGTSVWCSKTSLRYFVLSPAAEMSGT